MKKLASLFLLLAAPALAILTGCVSAAARQQAQAEYFATPVPTCKTDAECTVKMEAAQRWIAQNIGWKLQTITPTLIQTFGPGMTEARSAATVVKEPILPNLWQINVRLWCNNGFGCFPDPMRGATAFNQYLNAVPTP